MSKQVTFMDFGPAFLSTLLTESMLNSQLLAALPPIIPIEMEGTSGSASFKGPLRIVRQVSDDEILFETPISLLLNINTSQFNLGQLEPITVTFPLRIAFKTYDPLMLFGDILPIRDEEIVFEHPPHLQTWIALLAKIRPVFTERLRKQIGESLGTRIMDLEAVLLEHASAGKAVPGEHAPTVPMNNLPQGLLPRDAVAEGVLSRGRKLVASLLLLQGEQLRLTAYARAPQAPPPMFSGVLAHYSLYYGRSRTELVSSNEGMYKSWGPIWSRTEVPGVTGQYPDGFFVAEKSGWYRVEIASDRLSDGNMEVRLRQERKLGRGHVPPGKRIDFRQFGFNLINIGFSAKMLENELGAALSANLKNGAIRFPLPELPSLGAFDRLLDLLDIPRAGAELEVVPKLGEVTVIPSGDPNSRAVRAVPVELVLRVNQGNERLLGLPVNVRLVLGIETVVEQVAIQIKLMAIEGLDFNAEKMDGTLADRARKKASGVLNDAAADSVEKLVAKMLGPSGFVVKEQAIAAIQQTMIVSTPPAKRSPRPVGAGLSVEGIDVAPGGTWFKPVPLQRGQKITITVEAKPKEAPGLWGATIDLAVCDEFDGMFDMTGGTADNGSRAKQTLKLAFEAPDNGVYRIRLRAHPLDGEIWKGFTCDLEVK